MKGKQVGTGNTISRYCGGATVEDDGRILPTAFMLRAKDREHNPPYISFNWLEFFDRHSQDAQIEEIRTALKKKLNIGSNAKLALLSVADIHREFYQNGEQIKIDIQHLPEETPGSEDPSHCGFIMDVDIDEGVIATLLAQLVSRTVPAQLTSATP